MPRQTGFVQSSDAQLYYEMYGPSNLPVLILLHGNGESLRCFDVQTRYFASHYQVLAIDSRGHGRSTGVPRDYAQMADDVLNMMDALNIEKAHLLGFSDGGILALYLACKTPQRILSLILAGANYATDAYRLGDWLSLRIVYGVLCVGALFSTKARHRKQLWKLMLFHPHFSEAELRSINMPALVIAGEHDMIRKRHTQRLAALLSNAELQIVPNADHFLPYKKPEVFNNIVKRFLDSLK